MDNTHTHTQAPPCGQEGGGGEGCPTPVPPPAIRCKALAAHTNLRAFGLSWEPDPQPINPPMQRKPLQASWRRGPLLQVLGWWCVSCLSWYPSCCWFSRENNQGTPNSCSGVQPPKRHIPEFTAGGFRNPPNKQKTKHIGETKTMGLLMQSERPEAASQKHRSRAIPTLETFGGRPEYCM